MTATGLLIGHAKQNSPWPTDSCELAQAFLIDIPPDCGAGWVKLDPTHTCRLHASSLERSHFIPNPNTSTAEALAGLVLAGIVSTSGLFRDFLQGVPETHLREDTTPAGLLPSHGRLKKKTGASPSHIQVSPTLAENHGAQAASKPHRSWTCLRAMLQTSLLRSDWMRKRTQEMQQWHMSTGCFGGKRAMQNSPEHGAVSSACCAQEWCQDHWSVARIRPLDEITTALAMFVQGPGRCSCDVLLQPLVLEGCT